MKQIKIRNKNYNCSNAIYYHIQGLESENRLFNMEIKGHEQSEFELSKRIDKEIERLKDDNKYLNKVNIELSSEKNRLKSIIKEVREYVENDIEVYYVLDTRLNKAFDKTKKVKKDLLEILDKEYIDGKEND